MNENENDLQGNVAPEQSPDYQQYDPNFGGVNYAGQQNSNYPNQQGGNYPNQQGGNYPYQQGGNYAQPPVTAEPPVFIPEPEAEPPVPPAEPAPAKPKKGREENPKKRLAWTISLVTILVILLGTQGLFVGTVIRLEMVPFKWLAALIGGLLLLSGLVAFLMFVRFKKPVCLARKIIAIFMAVVFAVPCYFGSQITIEARDAVEKVTGKTMEQIETDARTVYVLVLNKNAAKSMADTAGYKYGYLANYDVKHMPAAMEIVNQAAGSTVNMVSYSDYFALVEALYSGEIDAVLMHGASIEALCGEKDYGNFSSQVRILKGIPYTDLMEPGETDPLKDRPTYSPVNLTQMPFAFYLSGSDTRNDKLTVSRSDVNILVIVNPTTRQILMVNTPRDYHVPNPVGNGALDKLTHCGLYGPRCSMQVLEELYNLSINFYGQINFTGLETLIDAMGGVSVVSDEAFRAGTTYIQVGKNELNGAAALEFARERHNVTGGDNGRGENQMRLMKGIIDKLTSGTTILSNYSEILSSLEGMFATSASAEDIATLVKFQLDEMPTWNIQSFAVTGIAGNAANYSAPGTTAYVTHIDQASVDYAAELIDRVYRNEILTESDMKMPK